MHGARVRAFVRVYVRVQGGEHPMHALIHARISHVLVLLPSKEILPTITLACKHMCAL